MASQVGKAFRIKGTLLMAVIADAATVTGMLLTGMGERNHKGQTNFFIVEKDTPTADIEQALEKMLAREDIGIILVGQSIAERIRPKIVEHELVIPTILEIPSKDQPYDPEKDTVVTRAASILWGADTGMQKLKEIKEAKGVVKK